MATKKSSEQEQVTEEVAAEKPTDIVTVKANPALNRGCKGQVIVNGRAVPTEGIRVTRAEANQLCLPEIHGVPAVVMVG